MLSLPGSLWRTGSSSAVYVFRAANLASYRPLPRDKILASILSSLKHGPLSWEGLYHVKREPAHPCACILARPREGHPPVNENGIPHLPGPLWADDGQRDSLGTWDVVCRIVQINDSPSDPSARRDRLIKWNDHSSEVLSTVAAAVVSSASSDDPIVSPAALALLVQKAAAVDPPEDGPVLVPIRIFLTHAERVFVVHVPVDPATLSVFNPLETSFDRYRSRYNDGPHSLWPVAVEPEITLDQANQLPTGRVLDSIVLSEQHTVDVSVVQPTTGSLTILVDESTAAPSEEAASNTETGSANATQSCAAQKEQLASTLIGIRKKVASTFPALREASPALCLIAPMDRDGTDTLDGVYLCSCQADLEVRPLAASGTWDDTLPEPVLLALAAAQGLEGSVVHRAWMRAQGRPCGGGGAPEVLDADAVDVYAAHGSGTSQAQACFSGTEMGRRATAVRLNHTPSELVRGQFFFPRSLTVIDEDAAREYENKDVDY